MKDNLASAMLSGALAGVAGCVAMNAVSFIWASSTRNSKRPIVQHGTRPDVAVAQKSGVFSVPVATEEVADWLAKPVLGRTLRSDERDTGGKLVHYAFGASVGAAYGIGMFQTGRRAAMAGVPVSALVWIGGVLVALPALKLTAPPKAYDLDEHALGVSGHIAYGVALGACYRLLMPRKHNAWSR